MKRIISLSIIVLMLIGTTACKNTEGVVDTTEGLSTTEGILDLGDNSEGNASSSADFTYEVDSYIMQTAYITGYTGDSTSISIPQEIDGYTITHVTDLGNCPQVEEIHLPESVVKVNSGAFDETAFYRMSDNWDDEVLYLDEFLIYARKNIESCVVRNGTKHIAQSAFSDCEDLTDVVLPDSILSIGIYAFADCEELTNIDLGSGLQFVNGSAFKGCDSLDEINLPDTAILLDEDSLPWRIIEKISYIENGGRYVGKTLVAVESVDDGYFRIKDGTVSIASGAFDELENLQSVDIPDSVAYIGDYAFMQCGSLQELILPESLAYVEDSFIALCDEMKSFKISDKNEKFKTCGDGALYSKDGLRILSVPTGIRGIFSIADGTEEICDFAFDSCEYLTEIRFPESLKAIGGWAFCRCDGLVSFNSFPANLEYIDPEAFSECNNIQGFEVANNSPNFCSKDGILFTKDMDVIIRFPDVAVNEYIIPNTVEKIESYCFSYCANLEQIVIPDSVTTIGNKAFWCCANLKEIDLPNGVSEMGSSVFYGCDTVASITVPDKLSSIGKDTFYSMDGVTSIIVPGTVLSVGETAFSSMKSLVSITFEEGVSRIGQRACAFNDKLESVYLPLSLTNIAKDAFLDCNSLKDIYFAGTKEQWDLFGMNISSKVTVHYGS